MRLELTLDQLAHTLQCPALARVATGYQPRSFSFTSSPFSKVAEKLTRVTHKHGSWRKLNLYPECLQCWLNYVQLLGYQGTIADTSEPYQAFDEFRVQLPHVYARPHFFHPVAIRENVHSIAFLLSEYGPVISNFATRSSKLGQ